MTSSPTPPNWFRNTVYPDLIALVGYIVLIAITGIHRWSIIPALIMLAFITQRYRVAHSKGIKEHRQKVEQDWFDRFDGFDRFDNNTKEVQQ